MSFRLSFLVEARCGSVGDFRVPVCAEYISRLANMQTAFLSARKYRCNFVCTRYFESVRARKRLALSLKIGHAVRNFLLNVAGRIVRHANYFDKLHHSYIDDKAN